MKALTDRSPRQRIPLLASPPVPPPESGTDDPNELRRLIAAHPFFKDLRPEHLDAVADCAIKAQFNAGEFIFHQGDPADRFYLITEGAVALEARSSRNTCVVVDRIGAGSVLGWSWLVEPYRWHFDARATMPTRAIFVYGTWLRELYEENGALGYEMLKRIAIVILQRLQATRYQLLSRLDSPEPRHPGAPASIKNRPSTSKH